MTYFIVKMYLVTPSSSSFFKPSTGEPWETHITISYPAHLPKKSSSRPSNSSYCIISAFFARHYKNEILLALVNLTAKESREFKLVNIMNAFFFA
jgi:hypothetical protein